jgi:hypothetical protein
MRRNILAIAAMAVLQAWLPAGRGRTAVAGPSEEQARLAPLVKRPITRTAAMPDMRGLDLAAMAEVEWRMEDGLLGEAPTYTEAIAWHLPRAKALLADLRGGRTDVLAREAADLAQIEAAAQSSEKHTQDLYLQLRRLKRKIVRANPRAQFEKLLFAKAAPTRFRHCVMQNFGIHADPGGGLFVLDQPWDGLAAKDILDGHMEKGCLQGPSLSYDGKRLVFAWVDLSQPLDRQPEVDSGFFHLWTVNVDGTDLEQITSGPFDDVMPCWLPDGGIAFCSTRRKAHARCFGGSMAKSWSTYTLHRIEADGIGLRTLSFHDTNEWYPSVMPDGQILYARWDYVDREVTQHHNLWLTRPDGTNPIALWGNGVANPQCMFQARPVPGSSKIVFVASGHHFATGGCLGLYDRNVDNFNSYAAIERLTPDVPFTETEWGRGASGPGEWYVSPWPLSETYYLVAYSPVAPVSQKQRGANARNGMGLYLLDRFGNRELLYRDPDIASTNPIPLGPRPVPPVLPSQFRPEQDTGVMALSDVYEGLGGVPRGTIKELRIVQIFPNEYIEKPHVHAFPEANARAILGTVPVEADGSAHFEVPGGKPVAFQALTADGFAYQTMRSLTYVQPGERVSCIGCHEPTTAAGTNRPSRALRRPPSKVRPGPMSGAPFSYVRLVQPVWDKHCVSCHGKEKTEGKIDLTSERERSFTRSYLALVGNSRLVPYTFSRLHVSPPAGPISAMGSGLVKLLKNGHHKVRLSDDEWRRVAAWIDLNAVFYGSNDRRQNEKELLGGPIPMPDVQ